MSEWPDVSAAKHSPKYMQRELRFAPIIVDEDGQRWAKPARFAQERGLHPSTIRRMAAFGLIKSRVYGRRKLYLLDNIER